MNYQNCLLSHLVNTIVGPRDFYQLVPLFVKGFIIGGWMGYAMGKSSHWLINNIKLNRDGLYPVLVLGLAIFTYAATDFLGGNGFLAIYLYVLILGDKKINILFKK